MPSNNCIDRYRTTVDFVSVRYLRINVLSTHYKAVSVFETGTVPSHQSSGKSVGGSIQMDEMRV